MNFLFFTLCSNNYLAQAIVLGKSLLVNNSHSDFKIGLIDEKEPDIDYTRIPFDIIEVKKIGIPEFNGMIERYDITELNTAVKPFFFKYFWENQNKINAIIYLDPDIYVYNSFNKLEELFESNDIILTPHSTTPINDDKSPTENNFLNAGLYNLGFLAVKKTVNAKNMLDWWADRLVDKAYNNFEKGMFTDQLWMNFTPLFFENVCINRNPGYNMAYWNLHERSISYSSKKYYINNEFPLVFFHFSGFELTNPKSISKYQNRYSFEERPDLIDLFNNYIYELQNAGYKAFILIKCSYSKKKAFSDKEKLRRKLKNIPLYRRVIRSIVLRTIRLFKLDLQ